MNVGDFLICKNTFYDWYNIGDTLKIKLNNFHRTPIFKKGFKYRIDDISYFKLIPNPVINVHVNNNGSTNITTSTTTTTHSPNIITNGTISDYSYRQYLIDGKMYMVDSQVEKIFYSLKEQRQIKLKKIKEYGS